MSGLPSYEETQRGVFLSPLYSNCLPDDGYNTVPGDPQDAWYQQHCNNVTTYPLQPTTNVAQPVRLQVSLPPRWPVECATLTNYRYDTVDDHYSLSEPVLLLDRHGRPLRPGSGSGSHNGDPFLHYRIEDYLDAQDAIGDDIYATPPAPGLHESNHGGATTYEEFTMEAEDEESRARRRERTCAKGFFVVSLIISAIALIVFLVIAVLKSVHII